MISPEKNASDIDWKLQRKIVMTNENQLFQEYQEKLKSQPHSIDAPKNIRISS